MPWSRSIALLALGAAGSLLVWGGVAYRLGGARSATKVNAPDIRLMAAPAAVPLEQEALRAAPDPAVEQKLQEFQEAFAKVWRAGLEHAATESEPSGGTATTATTTDPPTTTTAAPANGDGSAAPATASADASAATATAIPIATTTAYPPTESATAIANAALPTPTATATAAAIANADPPTAPTTATEDASTVMATAAAGSGAVTAAEIIDADASPQDIRVVMYTTSWCGVCKRAKAWMIGHGVAFEERNADASAEYALELLLRSPRGAVPTFDVEGDVMIGFSAKRLDAMIQRAAQRHSEEPAL